MNSLLPGLEQKAELSDEALSVIYRLREAYDAAFTCQRNAWDFSVELTQMQLVGVKIHVLRTLVCNGLIIHKRETTQGVEGLRTFEAVKDLFFSDQSCFVISKQGYEVAKSTKLTKSRTKNSSGRTNSSHHSGPLGAEHKRNEKADSNCLDSTSRRHLPVKPVWDRERRELRLGEVVVKRFRWPAENQELVLNAFEDRGWPSCIDDPLVAHPSICPKRRLHDTLKCLNRKQVNELVKFRGDGTGLGVLVEIRLAELKNLEDSQERIQ